MQFDIIIIGSGIVGLATAFKIKRRKPGIRLAIIDKEDKIAAHQTGHNSGVIHSGLYYKPGSLKATNCVNGYQQLIEFCNEHEVPYELCGKIVVATRQEQLPQLDTLYSRGTENGLNGIKRLRKEELQEYEPQVQGLAGLHVPQTGIIDYKAVCGKLAELVFHKETEIKLGEQVKAIKKQKNLTLVATNKNTYTTRLVINCAGLYSDKIAEMAGVKTNIKIIPFRGEYYKLKKGSDHLVRNLIYPVPDPSFPFLGVHFTRMIDGGIEAGPNAVLAYQREGYKKSQVNLKELFETLSWPGFQKVGMKYWKTGMGEMYRSYFKSAFARALQELVPAVEEKDLIPGGSGVRAQACDRSGKLLDDFLILENDSSVNVCNAPSPAATSSLSIGSTVASKALKRFQSLDYKFQ